MVSIRCKMVVKTELDKLGVKYGTVDLGEVEIESAISYEQLKQLKAGLLGAGLQVMENKKAVLIEKIKHVIIEMVHYSEELPKVKTSNYIGEKLSPITLTWPLFFRKQLVPRLNSISYSIKLKK